MYYENSKRWNSEIDTAQLIEFLENKGFHKVSEDARWLTYENDFYCTVSIDFDPWMHIDETDDDICYEYPCYVYFDYVDYPYNGAKSCTGLDDIDEYTKDCRRDYYIDVYGYDPDDDDEIETAAA